jgi:hypothetical protein
MFTNRKQYSLPAAEPGSNDFLALQYLGRLQIAVSGTYTGNLPLLSPSVCAAGTSERRVPSTQ